MDEFIELDTPPPSPLPWIDIPLSPEKPVDSQLEGIHTPVAKNRKRLTRPRNNKRRRRESSNSVAVHDDNDALDCQWETDVSIPLEDGIAEDNPIGQLVDETDLSYVKFVEAVLADEAPFYQISKALYVVSGWDVRRECNNVRNSNRLSFVVDRTVEQSSWYHLQTATFGAKVVAVCMCPIARSSSVAECLHIRFYHEYQGEKFPDDNSFEGAYSHLMLIKCAVMNSVT